MASETTASDLPEVMTPFRRIKAILGGSAGNLVEWYDWFAYSAFTLYFADHFFPKGDQTAQLLQAAAIFAVGFLARPVGAWAMGHFADRYGRKSALAPYSPPTERPWTTRASVRAMGASTPMVS